MAIEYYLAMTAAEFQNYSSDSTPLGWLSCHFSPWGKGLSNIPQELPPGSLLILDDANPVAGHDPETVLRQLCAAVQACQCSSVLLDFQRPDCAEAAAMAAHLATGLPCPVGTSALYSKGLSCAVLLPPVPPDVPLEEYIQPWAGREIWLELALDTLGYRITKNGAALFQPDVIPESSLPDDALCCHYAIQMAEDHIDFTLFRTARDLQGLMEKAEKLGITRCVGLWQELGNR